MHCWLGLQSMPIESVAGYDKTIENIESISRAIRFALVEMTAVGCYLPSVLVTLVNYFVFNLGDESYFLSAPIMWVPNSRFPFKCHISSKKSQQFLSVLLFQVAIQLEDTDWILFRNDSWTDRVIVYFVVLCATILLYCQFCLDNYRIWQANYRTRAPVEWNVSIRNRKWLFELRFDNWFRPKYHSGFFKYQTVELHWKWCACAKANSCKITLLFCFGFSRSFAVDFSVDSMKLSSIISRTYTFGHCCIYVCRCCYFNMNWLSWYKQIVQLFRFDWFFKIIFSFSTLHSTGTFIGNNFFHHFIPRRSPVRSIFQSNRCCASCILCLLVCYGNLLYQVGKIVVESFLLNEFKFCCKTHSFSHNFLQRTRWNGGHRV